MLCSTHFQREGRFPTEICVHISGLKNLDKGAVFVFPSIRVCLDCGYAEFVIPEKGLQQLSVLSGTAESTYRCGAVEVERETLDCLRGGEKPPLQDNRVQSGE
jgi:hypothetical protein